VTEGSAYRDYYLFVRALGDRTKKKRAALYRVSIALVAEQKKKEGFGGRTKKGRIESLLFSVATCKTSL
jgi:hypothetical protein